MKKRAVEQAFFIATFARLQGTLRFAPDIVLLFDGFLASD